MNNTEIAAHICRAVAELPDRNSPEDWPEAMLVTHDELQAIVVAAVEASARQLSEQPGFVMVPVDVLERAAESLGSFVSDHGWSDQDMQNMDNLDAFIARHKANLEARPLTASPTAPSTEASEPVRDEPKSLNAKIADQLRPFLKPGDKVIWREAFRWHDDNGVLSNHYDSMSVSNLADDFGYEFDWDLNMNHAAIVRALKGTP